MSHYYSTGEGSGVSPEQPVVGEAGTVAFANYDLWHRAMPNSSEKRRYMMKFLYARMSEPQEATWANRRQNGQTGLRWDRLNIKRCSDTSGTGIEGLRITVHTDIKRCFAVRLDQFA